MDRVPMPSPPPVRLPDWVGPVVGEAASCASDGDRMRVAVELARQNVLREDGGPFGAAIFAVGAERPIAVGVNLVEKLDNAVLHAEIVAFMFAQARLGSYTLRHEAGPAYELYTSCEPCAMCLGAALWSGVARIVCGAGREDAAALGFDEGPVFPSSYRYLEERGIAVTTGVLRDEAREVFSLYRRRGGLVYNG